MNRLELDRCESEKAKARNCGLSLKEYQRRRDLLLKQCRELLGGEGCLNLKS